MGLRGIIHHLQRKNTNFLEENHKWPTPLGRGLKMDYATKYQILTSCVLILYCTRFSSIWDCYTLNIRLLKYNHNSLMYNFSNMRHRYTGNIKASFGWTFFIFDNMRIEHHFMSSKSISRAATFCRYGRSQSRQGFVYFYCNIKIVWALMQEYYL